MNPEEQTDAMLSDRLKEMYLYVSRGATDTDLEAAGYTPEEVATIPKQEAIPFTPREGDSLTEYVPTVRDNLRGGIASTGEALGMSKSSAYRLGEGVAGSDAQMGLLDLAPVAGSIMAGQEGYRQAERGYNSGSKTDMAVGALNMGLGVAEAIPLVGAGVKAVSKAIPGKVKADIVGTARSLLDGDAAFRTESSLSPVGVGADVPKGSGAIGNAANGKNPFVVPKDNPTENLLDFYSPIKSSIEALNFGEKGLPGSVILKHLREKTPNTNIAELDSYKLELDPNTRYTQEDIKELLPKGDYKIKEVNPSSYYSTQRQKPKEGTSDYFELSLQGDAETPFNHLTDKDLAHARGSFIVGPDKKRLLVEELQSDLLQNVGKSRSTTNPTRSFFSAVGTDFEPLKGLGVDTDKLEGILQKNLDGAVDNETTVKELYNTFEVKPESLRGPPSSHLTLLTAKKLHEFGYPAEDIDDFLWGSIDLDFQSAISEATLQNKKAAYTKKDFPVTSTADVTKKLLLGLIAKAQKEGATEIVMPPLYRIAAMRAGDFMGKARGVGQELMDNAVVAAEKALKPTYVDSFDKATEMLNREFSSLDGSPIRVYEDDMRFQGSEFSRKGKEKVKVLDITNFPPLAEYRLRFAEGGMVEDEQMNRLMADGGMTDDGMTTEPVTGNEIPPGALASEVRDDVDAKLSGGEYVIPADVVRFFGVRFFEDLRGQAKQGLMEMEAEGRIGGNAVDSRGVPMGDPEDELTPEEEQMLQRAMAASGMAEGGLAFDRTQFTMPDYGTDGLGAGSPIESRQYFNPTTGEKQTVSFMNGTPLGLIPEGFVPWTQELQDTYNSNKPPAAEAPPKKQSSGSSSTEDAANDPTSSSYNFSSWADKNADAINSNPYEFGMKALEDTSGELGAKALGVAGLATGLMPLALGSAVLRSSNKIQNVAEANAALLLMEAQGLKDTAEYENLTNNVKKYVSNLSTAEQTLVKANLAGTGKNYIKALEDNVAAPSPTATPVANPVNPSGDTPKPAGSSPTRVPVPNTTPTAQAPTSSPRPVSRSSSSNDNTEARAIAKANAATGASKVINTPAAGPQRVSIPTTAPTNTVTKTVNTPSGPQKVTTTAKNSQGARSGFVDGGLVTKPTKTNPKSKGLGGKQ